METLQKEQIYYANIDAFNKALQITKDPQIAVNIAEISLCVGKTGDPFKLYDDIKAPYKSFFSHYEIASVLAIGAAETRNDSQQAIRTFEDTKKEIKNQATFWESFLTTVNFEVAGDLAVLAMEQRDIKKVVETYWALNRDKKVKFWEKETAVILTSAALLSDTTDTTETLSVYKAIKEKLRLDEPTVAILALTKFVTGKQVSEITDDLINLNSSCDVQEIKLNKINSTPLAILLLAKEMGRYSDSEIIDSYKKYARKGVDSNIAIRLVMNEAMVSSTNIAVIHEPSEINMIGKIPVAHKAVTVMVLNKQ